MKITVYTITDCKFSQQEKDYFKTNNLTFEEKNLETNKEFLTEMLAVSNNFAGTPVTKIEKDDGQIVVLKGFTKEEFDKTLGFGSTQAPQAPKLEVQPTPTPATPPLPVQPQTTPTTPAVPLSTETPAKVDDPLKSVLQDLETKSQESQTPTTPPTTPTTPNIPTFQDK